MEKKTTNTKSNKKKKLYDVKRPQTPYFLFCTDIRNKLKKAGKKVKHSAKKLAQLCKNLTKRKKIIIKKSIK